MTLEDHFGAFRRRDWELEEPDGTVRLAVVGVGGFARERALPGIESGEYCETTVLVSGSLDRTREVAVAFDVPNVIEYDEFLDGACADAYDAVYVATPNALHGRYTTAAAERGKHVICEKPLETTVERSRTVVDACESAGVTLMTAYRLQLEPTVRRTREMIQAGDIGNVVQVHGRFSNPLLTHADPGTWRLDADLAGGGALVDLGVYPLNTTRFVLEEDPISVSTLARSSGEPFDDVDEHVTFDLEFSTDAVASCSASFNAHAASRLDIIGTDGLISISAPFGGVVPQDLLVETGELCMEYTGPPTDEVREEFDYFGYCVLTGTTPEPDGRDGLEDVRIIEAAYEAAETDRRISLE